MLRPRREVFGGHYYEAEKNDVRNAATGIMRLSEQDRWIYFTTLVYDTWHIRRVWQRLSDDVYFYFAICSLVPNHERSEMSELNFVSSQLSPF